MSEHPVIIDSETVFHGKVFDVRIDRLRGEGREYRQDVVVHRGSFAILAEPSPGRVILVRQYRHATGRDLWELPAGKADDDETPEAGARRELHEETGFKAGSMDRLWSVYPTPGFCDEVLHIFYARDLQPGAQKLDEDEQIEVREFAVNEALDLQASGQIGDMKTLLALTWLRPRQHQ
ncbi:MAG: NUDIX hydrolase [Candidatus Eremiobacteraeota bacterium]|nr:NUDIX hydrolase [Candidatus Eremiobacteraeota bacterium]